MTQIPRDGSFDSTFALLREGYGFVSTRCQRHGTDIFRTRVMMRPAFCARGAAAAEMFYHPGRFTRQGAFPPQTLLLLPDRGSAVLLDGEAHRWRKRMLMGLMSPSAVQRMTELMSARWRSRMERWEERTSVVLLREAQEILCGAACEWAGIPLAEEEVPQRAREFAAMTEGAGAVGPRALRGLVLRARTERWVREVIGRVRSGALHVPDESPLGALASHRDLDGELLEVETAAVEMINLLRPTVSVAWFVTFAALALHADPESRRRIGAGDNEYLELFVHEVRRFYPLFPLVAGRAREPFEWRDHRFPPGAWVILDLYGTNHDPSAWPEPERFWPERFRRWDGSAFNFVPQGAGDHYATHRCAGEWITIELV
ncbi:MAG: cytochrome P450, partial [Gemmatimonadetes bacterium]|nr:cytochrome P450 [Gemmatimonadota bacterium]